MSRRTLIGLLVPLVLIASYYGVMSYLRAHVSDLIAYSVDKPLPEFQLVDRDGKQWSNKDLVGKCAVLHFFRSHCSSCDIEAPAIRKLEKRKPDDVVWLHVMTDIVLDVTPATTAATIARKEFSEPILMADAVFVELFHSATWAQVTPITYIVDKQGTVRYGLRGGQDAATIESAITIASRDA